MTQIRDSVLLCCLCLLTARTGFPAGRTADIDAGPLKVGIATADITPEGPVWMVGFAERTKPSEGVYRPLTARCIVFDNGLTRVAFVALDTCAVYGRQFTHLRLAAGKAGIPSQHLMINASHTHSGPFLSIEKNPNYVALFKARTDPLFAKAVADLKPARLDYTAGSCTMGISRRRLNAKGKCPRIRPEPRKEVDTSVPILRVLSPEGKVRAVVFGYGCHPVSVDATHYLIGPDYPGFARDWVEAAYPGCVAMFLQGCGADVMPRQTTPNGWFGHVLLDPLQAAAEFGHELGRAVIAALTVPPEPVPAPVQLAGIIESVPVPDKTDPKAKTHPAFMGAWRVGDVYLFGGRGEIAAGIGLRIKRDHPGLRLWVNGYTHWGFGYILERSAYPEGGYEIKSTSFSPEAGEIVVRNAARYIKALRAGRTGVGPIRGAVRK